MRALPLDPQPSAALIVLNLFLIQYEKYCYASLLNKLYKVFVCARTAGSLQMYVNKMRQNTLCKLYDTVAAVLFTTLIENLRLYSSAEAAIVLNLFLTFEQKMNLVFL